jgi:hypothetical protein
MGLFLARKGAIMKRVRCFLSGSGILGLTVGAALCAAPMCQAQGTSQSQQGKKPAPAPHLKPAFRFHLRPAMQPAQPQTFTNPAPLQFTLGVNTLPNLAQGPFLSNLVNTSMTNTMLMNNAMLMSFNNPFMSPFNSPFNNPFQSPFNNPFMMNPFNNAFAHPPFNNPFAMPFNNPFMTPFNNPFANPFAYQQNPFMGFGINNGNPWGQFGQAGFFAPGFQGNPGGVGAVAGNGGANAF